MSANQLWLDLRCDEGRVQVGIDVSFLSETERKWLFGVLESAREGSQLNFGASEERTGAVLQFTIAGAPPPEQPRQEVVSIQ